MYYYSADTFNQQASLHYLMIIIWTKGLHTRWGGVPVAQFGHRPVHNFNYFKVNSSLKAPFLLNQMLQTTLSTLSKTQR